MAKVPYIMAVDGNLAEQLKGLVSIYTEGEKTIIARYGVNKSTLKKLMKKENEKVTNNAMPIEEKINA